jgi:DUF971 family protein
MSSFGTKSWPTEIRLDKASKTLDVAFDDGKNYRFSAEFLRVLSPSAEVQGHSPDQKQLVCGRRHVGIMSLSEVGNYAIQIKFDDLHDTGIYSWEYLRELGENQDKLWKEYEEELTAAGKSREP